MMRKKSFRALLRLALTTVATLFAPVAFLQAQVPVLTARLAGGLDATISSEVSAPMPFIEPAVPSVVIEPPSNSIPHRFWDRENTLLFTAAGGWAAADFFVTRANLASGGHELNPVARVFTSSTPALAANFAVESGGTIALAYMFHRTRHHRLERLTSWVDISGSVGAVSYGLSHR